MSEKLSSVCFAKRGLKTLFSRPSRMNEVKRPLIEDIPSQNDESDSLVDKMVEIYSSKRH